MSKKNGGMPLISGVMLAAVHRFTAPREVVRPWMAGVLFDPHPDGGVVAVATDGVRMAVAHDPAGAGAGWWRFDRATLAGAARTASPVTVRKVHGEHVASLSIEARRARGDAPVRVHGAALDLGERPLDWRAIFAAGAAVGNVQPAPGDPFNARVLASFAFPVLGDDRHAMRLLPRSGAAVVLRDGLPWFVGAVMPMHLSRPKPAPGLAAVLESAGIGGAL